MPYHTSIVTLRAIALHFFLATRVAVARSRFGVKHLSMTGNPDFGRVVRVHLNTLEWLPIFLVPLWLSAIHLDNRAAAAVGLAWIVARLWYYASYSSTVEKRVPGFPVQALACLLLFVGAIAGIVIHLARG